MYSENSNMVVFLVLFPKQIIILVNISTYISN